MQAMSTSQQLINRNMYMF